MGEGKTVVKDVVGFVFPDDTIQDVKQPRAIVPDHDPLGISGGAGGVNDLHGMAHIHDQNQSSQLRPVAQIAADQRLPDMLLVPGRARKPVSRQVDQITAFVHAEKVEMLCAPRHLADESKPLVVA